jgi:2-polyprenyl-6-methoxyphenol hydroxylase-like FAD-dependent oxidoreductase
MNSVRKVLVIGGGIAGMSTAIELRKRGVAVDLVERDPKWRVYGTGISISGPALRAFKTVGVLPEILEQGWCSDGCDVCAPNGTVLTTLVTPRIAGADIPGGGGILRPVLARILSKATLASGTAVRLGVTFTGIARSDAGLDVSLTDGSRERYDLVVGADGLSSKVRSAIFPDAPTPKYTGQGCWRAVVPRLPEITGASMFLGRLTKAGVNLVSKNEMYLFCLDHRAVNERIPEEQFSQILSGMLAEFSGPVGQLRDALDANSRIIYRPLEAVLVPPPWHHERVVLVGDAAHATTPHLASGAAIAIEDAIVLAEELERAPTLEAALRAYVVRRFTRCKIVVESSLKLGEIEINGGSKDEHAQVMRDAMVTLLAPI